MSLVPPTPHTPTDFLKTHILHKSQSVLSVVGLNFLSDKREVVLFHELLRHVKAF